MEAVRLADRLDELVQGCFGIVRPHAVANPFTNANKILDHIMAYGHEEPAAARAVPAWRFAADRGVCRTSVYGSAAPNDDLAAIAERDRRGISNCMRPTRSLRPALDHMVGEVIGGDCQRQLPALVAGVFIRASLPSRSTSCIGITAARRTTRSRRIMSHAGSSRGAQVLRKSRPAWPHSTRNTSRRPCCCHACLYRPRCWECGSPAGASCRNR